MNKELFKFIIVGGINTAHYYAWYVLFYSIYHINYLPSHIIATVLSMIGSYFLNVFFTYKEKPSWKSFLLFPLTQITNTIVQLLCLVLFVNMLHMSAYLAPIATAIVSVPITFIVTRRVIRVSKPI
ncbi:GtrA family protein [Rummeliibacillus pycnus]|uniref:GtrA family protein n=1 Tax=Rummeliibacillus pycnus TaxID=101070 RepID=UPI000C99EFE2|nr:GtrA family protein [Rummeliibacillus pycnus]